MITVLEDGTLPAEAEAEIARAREERVAERLAAKEPELWGGDATTPELGDRLGWLDAPQRALDELDDVEAFAREVREAGFTHVLLLGMGGSSLAPLTWADTFGAADDGLALHVLDSTDPGAIADAQAAVPLDTTLFVVSTKSGGTIETISLFEHFYATVGEDGSKFVAITDPGSGLEDLARERGFRRTFLADPTIGGRYSALSAFGIVPAVLAGAPARALAEGALQAVDDLWPGVTVGAMLGAAAKAGRDKLVLLVGPQAATLGLWVEQLVAESTGKQGVGILPVADEPPGELADLGDDRIFLLLPFGDAGVERYAESLARYGHPVIGVDVQDPAQDLGRAMALLEVATATVGWSLGINPFDQPDVQAAKDATKQVLGEPELPDPDAGSVDELLDGAGPPQYVTLAVYAPPSEATDAAAARLRSAIRERGGGTVTTFGYGPRYLHSTGQCHKGGPPEGRFLVLLADPSRAEDVAIPGQEFGFSTLVQAQALGDLQTLRDRGRPAVLVRLEGDPAQAIEALARDIEGGTA